MYAYVYPVQAHESANEHHSTVPLPHGRYIPAS